MTSAADLEGVWGEINTPTTAGAFAGRLAPDLDATLGVNLALDHTGLRHLLVPIDPDATPPSKPATKGLEVSIEELKVGSAPARDFVDVACGDASMHHNFAVVSAEIITALAESQSDPLATIKQILARWRWFWSAPPSGLSDEAMIGLFGELWFLEYWLGGPSDAALHAWTGPQGDRHDFKWPSASVEVKATRVRTDGAAQHRISTLDQLEDAEQGDLFLFSLRVRPDPIAGHSLAASVDRVRMSLAGRPDLLVLFDELLGRAGYSPAHRDKYETTFRVAAEELYGVREGFPRLTVSSFLNGVPAGIDKIQYTLNLAACHPWLEAKSASDAPAQGLRKSLASSPP
jgi:hypothetical protein